jgi:glycosyltransferase involved in cell wall biosynthesis
LNIIMEQPICGRWGSTGVETMSLGKPVVCYLRPSWKKFFLKKFPEYTALPIVEANTQTIYEVLKKLVTDKKYRENKGRESRDFAEQHYDVKRNTRELASILEKL